VPTSSLIGREWALIDRFLDEVGVLAIITTWEVTFPVSACITALAGQLQVGVALGAAVAAANRSSHARRAGFRLALFGDPRLTLTRAEPEAELPRPFIERPELKEVQAYLADASFLRAYLSFSVPDLPPRLTGKMRVAQEAVTRYEYYLWRGASLEDSEESPGPRLRAAVLDFIAARGSSLYYSWMGLAHELSDADGPDCSSCGSPTRATNVSLRLSSPISRVLVRCPVCGIIADGVDSAMLQLRLKGSSINLSGNVPTSNWAGILHVTCQREEESTASLWPRTADGRPATALNGPPLLPPGPVRLAAVIMHGATISVASIPTRRSFWR
jgi:hypothetical protein